LDFSLLEIEKLIEEVTANDKQLEEGKEEQAQTISYLSKSLHHSKVLVEK
jgi:hypothetical protein